jgi:lipopolysaccharide biosynthesis regulator YciM
MYITFNPVTLLLLLAIAFGAGWWCSRRHQRRQVKK